MRYYRRHQKALAAALKHGIDPKTLWRREEDGLWVANIPPLVRRKTHCKNGHELTELNRIASGGCRICKNKRFRDRYKPKYGILYKRLSGKMKLRIVD